MRQLSLKLQHRIGDRKGEDKSDQVSDETFLAFRRPSQYQHQSNDIKVDISDYDGKLDADDFIK